jgi:uncharacterized protein (DUF433 family)
VSVKHLRDALAFAEEKLGIRRLLLREELRTEAGRVFLERYGQLMDLTASGQLAMKLALESHLKRIEWDAAKFPLRLYPFVVPPGSTERPIVIDPQIAFGRPVLARKAISTLAIVDRVDTGETVDDVAADYDLRPDEVEQAIVYERAA